MKKPLRQEFCRAAISLIGTPYEYGGRLMVPGGYGTDCWGLVADAMNRAGDTEVARQLSGWWTQSAFDELPPFVTARPAPGDLLFYGKDSTHITHVAIHLGGLAFLGKDSGQTPPNFYLSEDHLLSASGGDSDVKELKDALKRGARVKLFRSLDYRRNDFVAARSMRDYLF